MTQANRSLSTAQLGDIERTLQTHMRKYGYQLIDIPIIKPAGIFLTRAGDTIIDRLFTFERLGQQLTLRPEFTAAAAHRYVSQGYHVPVRWQFSGAIFEDDPNSISLQYQKQSIGAEFIGQTGIQATAEVIAMALGGLQELGVEHKRLVMGHVGLQMHLLRRFGLDTRTNRMLLAQREYLKQGEAGFAQAKQNIQSMFAPVQTDDAMQEMSKNGIETQKMLDVLLDSTRYGTTMGGRSREDIAQRLLSKRTQTQSYSHIEAALHFLAEWMQISASIDEAFTRLDALIDQTDTRGQKLLDNWRETIDVLTHVYGIDPDQMIIQADLTKNWEYYTGAVFGIQAQSGAFIGSGGRYDDLASILGSDVSVPAVGFAYYMSQLVTAIPDANLPKTQTILTVTIHDMPYEEAMTWVQGLRNQDIAVALISEDALITATVDGMQYAGQVYKTQQDLINALEAQG